MDPRARLAYLVLERIRVEGGADPMYDSENFAVYYGRDAVLYLDNLFAETAGYEEAELSAHIEHFIATMIAANDAPGSWDAALPRLRPVLKPSTYTLGAPPPGLLVSRRVFPLVDELVAVDTPGRRTIVSWETISEWGVDPATVFSAARSNLATITVHADPTKGRAVQRLVDSGNSYFTSWLLDPGWLASHRNRFGCAPVAFVPDVDTIFVVPSDDPDILARHFALVEQQYTHTARGLSPQAYTVDDDGTIVTFDAVQPDSVDAARARCVHIAREYDAQSDWLRSQYGLDGTPGVVGNVTVTTTPFGPRTVTIWDEGADCLLPQTDLVAFCSRSSDTFYVQFEDVARITGIVPTPGIEPGRFHVTAWPDAGTVEQLRAHGIPLS
ncbi:hypothetical protein SAMN05421642_11237 [Rhodococcoides kyotonense]|uniref:Uncharacterized protein n=1 Tax=Rhodococcoides kyotonense TaxID=398843 RepID=A0A239L6X0_9NOCA|nr:hypothetical protein SAMN05421642_11237 [Rhodococcus kyotonensis]